MSDTTTLAKRMERGDRAARDELVALASSIAPDADLVSAVERYDWRRDGDFESYVRRESS